MGTFSALLAFCAVNSTHRDQWYVALMFSLICAWTKWWANDGDAGDLRRHRASYDVTVIALCDFVSPSIIRSLIDDCESGIRDFETLGLLFHWGRVNYTITGSDNELAPIRHQIQRWFTPKWTLWDTVWWNFNTISNISVKKVRFKCRLPNGGHFAYASVCYRDINLHLPKCP